MNRRIFLFSATVVLLFSALAAETLWLHRKRPVERGLAAKRAVVTLAGLPDLSVATEARFIRFRSLADLYAPFNESPVLPDYFPASFAYAPSPIEHKVPSKMEIK
ncbi:hypothetical protein [Hydrogenimonas sp. SS33]|uniref:hypothetical protein n=1 Tax=Hydrogenimonas leucolamina TaxID=2954236 RepID=UPI00336BDDDE